MIGSIERVAMRRSLEVAERGRGRVEPNPMVGAAVIASGAIVAVGHHEVFGGPHAEVQALRAAGAAARGATLVVTLEPCAHHGKTPPCVDAIVAAGVRRVVAAMRDPFDRVDGRGFDRLRAAGIEVVEGVEEESARRLNAPFLKRIATGRPWAIAKWAMSLDGRTATRSGESRWISNELSRARVHELRGRVDAVLVGIGTALADDPMLSARPPGPRRAARVVLDAKARLPLDSQLVRTAHELPTIVAATDRADPGRVERLRAAGVEVLVGQEAEAGVAPLALMGELGKRGMCNVLIEGGGRVLGSFHDAGEVDEVIVYVGSRLIGGPMAYAPLLGAGAERMVAAMAGEPLTVEAVGGDARLAAWLPRPWWRTPACP